jgi:hypothetical protein
VDNFVFEHRRGIANFSKTKNAARAGARRSRRVPRLYQKLQQSTQPRWTYPCQRPHRQNRAKSSGLFVTFGLIFAARMSSTTEHQNFGIREASESSAIPF